MKLLKNNGFLIGLGAVLLVAIAGIHAARHLLAKSHSPLVPATASAPPVPTPRDHDLAMKSIRGADTSELGVEGFRLSSEEAERLEKQLETEPNDLASRIKLLGYYHLKQFHSKAARAARQRHILWIIATCPEAEIAGNAWASLNPTLDGPAYEEAKKLWLEQVGSHRGNTTILGNAANFFLISDQPQAEKLLKESQAVEPQNPEWYERLGSLYEMEIVSLEILPQGSAERKREVARKCLEQYERAVQASGEEQYIFDLQPRLATAALTAGEFKKAAAYSADMLEKAELHKADTLWDCGEAIHVGNIILGELALRRGDIRNAREYLLASARLEGVRCELVFMHHPGMTLARGLLRRGERDAVVQYLQLCSQYWRMDKDSKGYVGKWISEIKKGKKPDLTFPFFPEPQGSFNKWIWKATKGRIPGLALPPER